MKTAISVPDDTFDEVSRRAQQLGMSRSEFFAVAARHYLLDLDRASVTRQVDAALDTISFDESAAAAAAAGRARLAGARDW